jgi:ferredoxin-NADP reductase
MDKYDVKLVKKEEIAEGTTAFYFAKPPGFDFIAGQFLIWKHTEPQGPGLFDTRHDFSIASSPYEENLLLTSRMRDSLFKNALKELPIGGKMNIEGPYGHFTLHDDTSIPAVFLAGGIGITPVRSIVLQSLYDKSGHKLFVFYSNRRPEDAAFLDELSEIKNPNFKLIATMTEMEKSKQKWTGEVGFISINMIKKYLPDVNAPIYYIVGPPQMVDAMKNVLREAEVAEPKIRWENFTGY